MKVKHIREADIEKKKTVYIQSLKLLGEEGQWYNTKILLCLNSL